MDNTTMNIIPASWAALVPSADLIGGATGVFTRDRIRVSGPKALFVVDPRPDGPVVS